eukprot:6728123-Pyramimonas_sp.AAC.1
MWSMSQSPGVSVPGPSEPHDPRSGATRCQLAGHGALRGPPRRRSVQELLIAGRTRGNGSTILRACVSPKSVYPVRR